MAVFVGSYRRGEDIVCLLLQVLCHPGENKCICSSYSSWSDPSRLLAHAIPTPGSMNSTHSEIQQDNWHHEQDDQEYNAHPWNEVVERRVVRGGEMRESQNQGGWEQRYRPCGVQENWFSIDYTFSGWCVGPSSFPKHQTFHWAPGLNPQTPKSSKSFLLCFYSFLKSRLFKMWAATH